MDVAVIGAGPTGLTAALLLARRGHHVSVIESDPGPDESGGWARSGVYQFHQPHLMRAPTVTRLERLLPDVLAQLLEAGAQKVCGRGDPGYVVGMRIRRVTFDRVLYAAASVEPGVRHISGRALGVEIDGADVRGVRLRDRVLPADLVVDATGRSGLTTALRAQAGDSSCGFSYVSRAYRLRDGADPGPINVPPGFAVFQDGYFSIVFLQENGWFQVQIVRATTDNALAELRHETVWDAVVPEIPAVAEWIDPARSAAMGPPNAGNAGRNTYRHQAVAVTGLLAIGDAVCTTNPMGARGISLGISGAAALADIVAEHDRPRWTSELERWCESDVRPWFEDQVESDAAMLRRWAGEPIDPTGRLPVDLVAATAQADPRIMRVVGPYNLMATTSAALDPVRERAREIFAGGWRQTVPESPTHGALVRYVTAATQAAVSAMD
ncbi:FAD-dependent oxidoreductase [Nocardia bovistercoris]|uniref:FAD-dependent oxidoreductase n=1 Tax=Nocardia bovistercoris TaxID=2785916 RepID=A0A931N7A5_9NOCA|nr:FAD-dependent oxidoreductase [Nocardia bovistercoris]MBH0781864.1 FAD-dependent oxidoreductase [Nocardia bovistercoris]